MFRGGYGNSSYTRDKLLQNSIGPEKDEFGNIIITKRTSTRIAQKKQQKEEEEQQQQIDEPSLEDNFSSSGDPSFTDSNRTSPIITSTTINPRTSSNVTRLPKLHRKNSLSSYTTHSSSVSLSSYNGNNNDQRSTLSSSYSPFQAYVPPQTYTMIDNDGYDEYGFYHGIPVLNSSSSISTTNSTVSISNKSNYNLLSNDSIMISPTEPHRNNGSVPVIPNILTGTKRSIDNTFDHAFDPSYTKLTKYTDNIDINDGLAYRSTTTGPRKGSMDGPLLSNVTSITNNNDEQFVYSKDDSTLSSTTTIDYAGSPTAGEHNQYRNKYTDNDIVQIKQAQDKKMVSSIPISSSLNNPIQGDEPIIINESKTSINKLALPVNIPTIIIPYTNSTVHPSIDHDIPSNSTSIIEPLTVSSSSSSSSEEGNHEKEFKSSIKPLSNTNNYYLPSTTFLDNLFATTPRGLQAAIILANNIYCNSQHITIMTPQAITSPTHRSQQTSILTPKNNYSNTTNSTTVSVPAVIDNRSTVNTTNNTTKDDTGGTNKSNIDHTILHQNPQYISFMIPVEALRYSNHLLSNNNK